MFHFFSLHLYNRLSAVGVTQQLPVWGPSLGTRGPPRGMVLNPGMPMDGWPWKDPPIFKFGKPAGKPSISIRAVASWRSVSHNQRVNDINVLICTDAYSDTHTHTLFLWDLWAQRLCSRTAWFWSFFQVQHIPYTAGKSPIFETQNGGHA